MTMALKVSGTDRPGRRRAASPGGDGENAGSRAHGGRSAGQADVDPALGQPVEGRFGEESAQRHARDQQGGTVRGPQAQAGERRRTYVLPSAVEGGYGDAPQHPCRGDPGPSDGCEPVGRVQPDEGGRRTAHFPQEGERMPVGRDQHMDAVVQRFGEGGIGEGAAPPPGHRGRLLDRDPVPAVAGPAGPKRGGEPGQSGADYAERGQKVRGPR